MQPLSLWEMIWQLGELSAIMTMMLVLLGALIWLMWKPLNFFDRLG